MYELIDERMLLQLVLLLDSHNLLVQVPVDDSDETIFLDHLLINEGSEWQFQFLHGNQINAAADFLDIFGAVRVFTPSTVLVDDLLSHDPALRQMVILIHELVLNQVSTIFTSIIGLVCNLGSSLLV